MQNRTNKEAELAIVGFLIMIVTGVAFPQNVVVAVVLPRLLWVSLSAIQKDVKTLSPAGERLIIFRTASEGSRPGRPPAGCTPAPRRDAAARHDRRSPAPRQSPRSRAPWARTVAGRAPGQNSSGPGSQSQNPHVPGSPDPKAVMCLGPTGPKRLRAWGPQGQ